MINGVVGVELCAPEARCCLSLRKESVDSRDEESVAIRAAKFGPETDFALGDVGKKTYRKLAQSKDLRELWGSNKNSFAFLIVPLQKLSPF